jgi:hypothetical protein
MMNLFGKLVELTTTEEEKPSKPEVPKLFDWLNAINKSKEDLRHKDPSLIGFETYIITKGLGQSQTTIGFANFMNKLPKIPKEMVHLFYLYGVPKNRAYAKWCKNSHSKDLKPFQEATGLGRDKALEALRVLSKQQIKQILKPQGAKVKNYN